MRDKGETFIAPECIRDNRHRFYMKHFLADHQRAYLIAGHRIERNRKTGDRIKAILLADQGESIADIAKFLFVNEETIRRHLQDYQKDDKTGIESGGSQGKLSGKESLFFAKSLANPIS
jgi:DNA-binding NarL/FixJ family response regulator